MFRPVLSRPGGKGRQEAKGMDAGRHGVTRMLTWTPDWPLHTATVQALGKILPYIAFQGPDIALYSPLKGPMYIALYSLPKALHSLI